MATTNNIDNILGAATATSINKVAITAPATSATITVADGKTLTCSNTLTFTGTDSSSVAFGAGGTVLYSPGGTWNKISSSSASSSSQIVFTGLSTSYARYRVVMQNVTPATDNTFLKVQVSTDNGSTFVSTNTYYWSNWRVTDGAGSAASGSTGDSGYPVHGGLGLDNVVAYLSGWFEIEIGTTRPCMLSQCTFIENTAASNISCIGGGTYATANMNAFRFYMSSGNITTGTFTLYGMTA